MVRLWIAVLIGAAGCGGASLPEPNLEVQDLPTQVTLAVGEEIRVAAVTVRFSEVKSDSRCPTDVVCVWAGNAETAFAVAPSAGDGPTHLVALNTTLEPKSGSALGLTLTLIGLSPEPISTTPTRDYRAEIRVDKTP